MTAIDENKPHGSDFPWGLRFYSVLRFPLGLVGLPPSGEGGVFRGEGGANLFQKTCCGYFHVEGFNHSCRCPQKNKFYTCLTAKGPKLSRILEIRIHCSQCSRFSPDTVQLAIFLRFFQCVFDEITEKIS